MRVVGEILLILLLLPCLGFAADMDGDGLTDAQEDPNGNGVVEPNESNPLAADTDNDGARDDVEWFGGTEADDAESVPAPSIYRVEYGTFSAGVDATIRLHINISVAGEYLLSLNNSTEWQEPEGWTISGGGAVSLVAGVNVVELLAQPLAPLASFNAYTDLLFRLSGNSVESQKQIRLAVDPNSTAAPTGASPQELAQRYAPVVRMHRDAFYLPLAAEDYLEVAGMDLGERFLARPPAPLDLAQSPYPDAQLDLLAQLIDSLRQIYPRGHEPVVYYTITRANPGIDPTAPAGFFALQYYMLFFVDELGVERSREGDWQVFQVLLDASGSPYKVVLTQAWEEATNPISAESAEWGELRKEGTHPVLFVSGGENSLYLSPGARRGAELEVSDGLGTWCVPPGVTSEYPIRAGYTLEHLPRLTEAGAGHWLSYAGAWGIPVQRGGVAPLSPSQQGPAFWRMGELQPWLQPFALGDLSPEAVPQRVSEVKAVAPLELAGKRIVFMNSEGAVSRFQIDSANGALSVMLPVETYTAHVVDVDSLNRETVVASLRFPAFGPKTNLMPMLPLGVVTDLGTLTYVDERSLESNLYAAIDTDSDGIADGADNDADGDGVQNLGDTDDGGDGYADEYQTQDKDGDGVPRYYDVDDDGDGVLDAEDSDADGDLVPDAEQPRDFDGDGFMDAVDRDLDNDGAMNEDETAAGTNVRNYFDSPAKPGGDVDGDGDHDIADAQRIVNMALRTAAYDPRGDFDADAQITAVDVQWMIGRLLQQ